MKDIGLSPIKGNEGDTVSFLGPLAPFTIEKLRRSKK
jgi:hypothetical protein